MDGTVNTEQLPDPLAFALDEVLATVNGVDPVERDAEYEDCSDEELHIHKQLGRIRALISQIRAGNNPKPAEDAEPDLRHRLAAELHRIADDLVTQQLPLYDLLSARLYLGVLDSRADLQRWADYLGTEIAEDGGTDDNIPHMEHRILFGDRSWGPELAIHAQIQPEPQAAEVTR